ncbi:acyltransferase family protein [Escherichia coli]|nr:acyltransferase [Escherichia coli]
MNMIVEPQYLIIPVVYVTFIISCFIFHKLKLLPHIDNGESRYAHIDGLRGLAAVGVICSHSWRTSFSGVNAPEILKADVSFNVMLGSMGVQMFFCITGFLFFDKILKSKDINWNMFFLSRVKRLAPLYIFACSIVAITMLTYTNFSFTGEYIMKTVKVFSFGLYGTSYNIDGVELGHTISVLWTLPYEWKFYLFLPFAVLCLSDRRFTIAAVVISLLWSISFLSFDDGILYCYFITGGVTAVLLRKIHLRGGFALNIIFFVIMIINIYSIYWKIPDYGYERFILSSLMFISIMFASPAILKLKTLRLLGEISYSTYLMHAIIFFLVGSLIKQSLNTTYHGSEYYLFVLSILCACIASISVVTFKYIEYPFIKKHVKYQGNAICLQPSSEQILQTSMDVSKDLTKNAITIEQRQNY